MASLDTINGSVIPLEGTGAALRFRDQNVTFDLLRLSIESSDRDVFRKTILKSTAGRFGGSRCPRRGRLIADLFVSPAAPSLMTDPQLVDLLFNGAVATFHSFAVSERSWLDGQRRLIRTLTLEHTGEEILAAVLASTAPPVVVPGLALFAPNDIAYDDVAYDFTTVSITFWARWSIGWPGHCASAQGSTGDLVHIVSSDGPSYIQFHVALKWNNTTKLYRLAIRYRKSASAVRETEWTIPTDYVQHSYAMTFVGVTEILLIDGVAQSPVATSGTVGSLGYSYPVAIGRFSQPTPGASDDGADSMFLEDLRIWNRTLTESELRAQAVAGSAYLYVADMYAAYLCSEGDGRYVADASGQGRTLDLGSASTHLWMSGHTLLDADDAYSCDVTASYLAAFNAGGGGIGLIRGMHPLNRGKIMFEVTTTNNPRYLYLGVVDKAHARGTYPGHDKQSAILMLSRGAVASSFQVYFDGMGVAAEQADGPTFATTDRPVIAVFCDFTGATATMHAVINGSTVWDLTPLLATYPMPLSTAWYPVFGQAVATGGYHTLSVNFGQSAWAYDYSALFPGYGGWIKDDTV